MDKLNKLKLMVFGTLLALLSCVILIITMYGVKQKAVQPQPDMTLEERVNYLVDVALKEKVSIVQTQVVYVYQDAPGVTVLNDLYMPFGDWHWEEEGNPPVEFGLASNGHVVWRKGAPKK